MQAFCSTSVVMGPHFECRFRLPRLPHLKRILGSEKQKKSALSSSYIIEADRYYRLHSCMPFFIGGGGGEGAVLMPDCPLCPPSVGPIAKRTTTTIHTEFNENWLTISNISLKIEIRWLQLDRRRFQKVRDQNWLIFCSSNLEDDTENNTLPMAMSDMAYAWGMVWENFPWTVMEEYKLYKVLHL